MKNVFAAALVLWLLAAGTATAGVDRWPAGAVKSLATIPVQDGGRIKPLDTYARVALLKLNGKRTYTTEDGERLEALPWLLDVLFYPQLTRDYAHFNVDNSDVLITIGVTPKDKRDRYSYAELLPGRAKLFQLAQQYGQKDQKKLDPFERMVLNLAVNLRDYELLAQYFDFARLPIALPRDGALEELFGQGSSVSLSGALSRRAELRALSATGNAAAANFLNALSTHVLSARALALIPPSNPTERAWYTASSLFTAAMANAEGLENELAHLAALESLQASLPDAYRFAAAAEEFHTVAAASATARNEYAKVPLETQYYSLNLLFWAQWLFVLSFIVVALSWLGVKTRWLGRLAMISVAIPWALLVIAIAYRCVLRGRPPVTTLYETTLFITAVAVLLAMIMEYLNRQRIAVALASSIGALGLFLAYKYEMSDRQDTMPNLVAVLDTNFWLSTHVTTVTMGYAAGLLSAFLGAIYILARLIDFRSSDKAFYKTIVRMTYGAICFGLFFSVVGTVLGGIWANYSWGRFWGWDPKENGALMIVLCNLGILHARMGGYIRELGIAMASAFNGMVVAFSWWGVNLLGVGLHSYGFTSGIWGALQIYWLIQTVILFAGVFVFARERVSLSSIATVQSKQSSTPAELVTK